MCRRSFPPYRDTPANYIDINYIYYLDLHQASTEKCLHLLWTVYIGPVAKHLQAKADRIRNIYTLPTGEGGGNGAQLGGALPSNW